MKQLSAFFSGTVQGVGFRYTTRGIAKGYAVTGYVKNLSDGKVELLAEGDEKEVQAFLKRIRESELAPYIRDVQVNWQEAQSRYQTFEIAY